MDRSLTCRWQKKLIDMGDKRIIWKMPQPTRNNLMPLPNHRRQTIKGLRMELGYHLL